MASSLRPNLTSPGLKTLIPTKPTITIPIRCGARSNRGPLVKGRTLSTEAILAVQFLKRAHNKSSSPNPRDLPNLPRLIKSDLLSILRELLRQDLCSLALHVVSILRSEYSGQIDLNLYGEVISALSRNKLFDTIDDLIDDLGKDERGIQWESDKGLLKVIRGVVEAERKESTVKIYQMMRKSGVGTRGQLMSMWLMF